MFKKRTNIRFKNIDPLGDGLGDDIARERTHEQGMMFLIDTPPEELSNFWNSVVEDVRNDPNWFSFTED